MGGKQQQLRALFLGICLTVVFAWRGFAEDPWLPRNSVVVLMSGLSGDIESEKAYHEQLQTWLEVLQSQPEPPRKVYILSDAPESVTAPAGIPLEVFKSSREQFQALGKKLAGQTNPLVAVIWGHGGMQGRTPVFHVGGPRITPADFKAFAAQAATTESRWILLFRGSGNFAAELAAEKRAIIASEKETMFTSDPIGMSLVLKTLRAKPAISFQALGDELGRTTLAWYKERNLARTEEPTLWLALDTPKVLAPVDTATTPLESEKDGEAPAHKFAALPTATTNLSAAWKEIMRVEPRKYPDADGVILRRRINYTLGNNPAVSADHEEFIQILTPEGKHYGDFDFSFSPPDESITFLDCEILRPDGKLLSLDPDEIHDAAANSFGEYHAERRKIFSLPGVAPGAVLHVHYRNEWKNFPLPHVSLDIPLTSEEPIVDSFVQITVPKESAFHFAFDQISATDPAIKQSSYGSSYTWQFHDVAPHQQEPLSPPSREPGLLLSTFPDWQDFASWYSRISHLADTITPELKAKAAEVTAGAKDDRERAMKLFDYVTGLRYVAVPLGVNSFRPHAADNVLKNQYGDCKDKANLFNTLLRSLNVEADLVLVPRFSQALDSLPGFAFNHAISRVKIGGETLWVDTTDDVCRFGMLPPGDPGRKVLVVDGKTSSLTQLPLPTAKAHQLKLRGKVDCAGTVDAPTVELSATALGFCDYTLRTAAQDFRGHKTVLPLLAMSCRPVAGTFAMEKQSHTSVAALGEEFAWNADGTAIGIIARAGGRQIVRAPFWLPHEWDAALNHRKNPLFLNQGYPLLLDEEMEILLPPNAGDVTLPEKKSSSTEPLLWAIEWSKSDGKVIARLRVELVKGELSASETPAFQKQLRVLLSALAEGASYVTPR